MTLTVGLVMGGIAALPGLAQQANFESFTLSEAAPTANVSGSTNAIFALSSIAGRDRNGNICTGFADTNPDHIMVLSQDIASLTLRVNSNGNDTSLLVQGPNDDTVRCGEDIDRRNPDALIQDQGWAAGTYRIWVGSHSQGQRYSYSLSVSP
ncbi:hypothetical protein [Nodosilinea nodulosa]|uniref:hypothetical protein n=1 Tax=Nodosilinea nodulosa TaxID=416001 RepID=UPI000474CE95|nr:hypothetical protein [Nodosilinea nodulosa]